MRAHFLLPAILLFGFFCAPAQAQVFVLGDGPASACYQAAEFGTGATDNGFEVCSLALNTPGVSSRDRAATYVNRAVIRMRAGDFQGAYSDSNNSIGLVSSMGEAYVNRGAALLNLMRPMEALDSINQGVTLGSSRLHLVYYDRAAAKEILGDVRGAYADYRMSLQVKPDFALATEQLSRFQVVRRAARGNGVATDEVVALTALPLAPK